MIRGIHGAWVLAQWVTAAWAPNAYSQSVTPVAGHYPPGQTGIRGASSPQPGITFTNFSRFFTNLEVFDTDGNAVAAIDELRYANISMLAWATGWKLLGMRYGALIGVPFATGNLRRTADADRSSGLGLGDVLITPLSLYGMAGAFDYQFQFTVWTASGRHSPGSPANRGAGFWALVYSLGGVYHPRGNRGAWSLSAVTRIEQNFEQEGSGITPGDDIVIDWGAGRILQAGRVPIDVGASGFATWQLTLQSGGDPGASAGRYRYFGIGPEAAASFTPRLALRIRAHWEFGVHNAVRGNNLWVIVNYGW